MQSLLVLCHGVIICAISAIISLFHCYSFKEKKIVSQNIRLRSSFSVPFFRNCRANRQKEA